MIYKKQYGHPFDTESVVGSFVPAMETIPYLTREPDGFSYAMDPQDILYGLGENIRGINKTEGAIAGALVSVVLPVEVPPATRMLARAATPWRRASACPAVMIPAAT